MTINIQALHAAAEALKRDLGSLDDLRPEVRNTLANIYYRFHLLAANSEDPAAALNLKGGDMMSLYEGFMKGMAGVLKAYKFAADLVRSIRETRKQNAHIFEFLQTHFLDTFKYRIPNADAKSGLRRAIERRFRKVDEISGLYNQMAARE